MKTSTVFNYKQYMVVKRQDVYVVYSPTNRQIREAPTKEEAKSAVNDDIVRRLERR